MDFNMRVFLCSEEPAILPGMQYKERYKHTFIAAGNDFETIKSVYKEYRNMPVNIKMILEIKRISDLYDLRYKSIIITSSKYQFVVYPDLSYHASYFIEPSFNIYAYQLVDHTLVYVYDGLNTDDNALKLALLKRYPSKEYKIIRLYNNDRLSDIVVDTILSEVHMVDYIKPSLPNNTLMKKEGLKRPIVFIFTDVIHLNIFTEIISLDSSINFYAMDSKYGLISINGIKGEYLNEYIKTGNSKYNKRE